MDNIRKGSWIVNTVKHTSKVRTDTIELNKLGVTEKAGKCGMLLGKLMADGQEIIDGSKLSVFARQAGISTDGINSCIKTLKNFGQVDYSEDELERINEVEIYCFSKDDALETVNDIFEKYQPDDIEVANLYSLEATFEVPRTREEILQKITSDSNISEKDVRTIIDLQDTLSLVKKEEFYDTNIYYNEYAFSGDAHKIAKALKGLDQNKRDESMEVMDRISKSQGYLADGFKNEIDPNVIKMLEGIGLIDGTCVESKFGNAVFYTTPQLIGPGIGASNNISLDVFHSAKILLSCLRYGEYKSVASRGAIRTKSKLINIINKLNRGEWVGPCTAIGQDYQFLEKLGVIQVIKNNNMYSMKLRQSEVGKLVKQMLEYNMVIDEEETTGNIFNTMPTNYISPEERRMNIEAKKTKPVKEIQDRIIESLRTGGTI